MTAQVITRVVSAGSGEAAAPRTTLDSTPAGAPGQLTVTLSKSQVEKADVELLASLGYKQEFKRVFTKLEVFAIAFNIMGVLPSIASTLIYALPSGGPISVVWGWAVAFTLIVVIGLALGDLGSAMPTSGGLYYWTFVLSSERSRRVLCWVVGYANTLASVASVASIDWAAAQMIMAAVSIASDGSFSPTNPQTFGVVCAILLVHAIITSNGTRTLARLQNIYTVICAALALATIIALSVYTPKGYKNDASYALGGWENDSGWNNGVAFFLAMLMPVWTIAMYDSCVHISEEASNAATAVPLGIVSSIVAAGLLGFGICIAITFNMGTDIDSIVNAPSGQPMATIYLNSLGKTGCLIIWSFVIIVQLMMGSSMMLASSRQIFAFSRDGALPFSKWLYRIHPRTLTPINTAWFTAIIAGLLCLLGLAGTAAISAVFSLSVVGSYIAYAIPIGVRLLNPAKLRPGPWYLGDRWSMVVAVVAVTFMAFMSVVVLFPSSPDPGAGDMNYAVVVTAGVMGFSLLAFYFPKWGGKYWFSGPLMTVHDPQTRSHPNLAEDAGSRELEKEVPQQNLKSDHDKSGETS